MVNRLILQVEHVATPLGEMWILCDADAVLCAVDWKDCEPRMHALLRRQYGASRVRLVEAGHASPARDALERYFAGELGAIDPLPVRTAGTDFQRAVWSALREIPAGEPTSYGALALALGRADAVRAVGHANGAEPAQRRHPLPPHRRLRWHAHRLRRGPPPQALAARPRTDAPPRIAVAP